MLEYICVASFEHFLNSELSFYFALCQAVDDVCTMVVYSSDDPPKEDCSSLNYPTIVHYSTWLRNMNAKLIIY